MKDDTVKIVHAETGLVGQCLPEALPAWLSNGWTRKEESTPVDAVAPTPNLLRAFKPEHTTMVKLDQDTKPDNDLED